MRLNTVSPGARSLQGRQRRADRCARAVGNAWEPGGVGVEVLMHIQAGEVLRCVRAEEDGVVKRSGFVPGNGQFFLSAEPGQRSDNALGPFRMTGRRIARAALVGDDFHPPTTGARG